MSKSCICTLFEKHFHFGLAGLINSLYQHGYRGDMYIGYRGELPFWTTGKVQPNPSLRWENAATMTAAGGMHLHFLPVNTPAHLTNYKPEFFLELWKGCAAQADAIVYFDPDIVIKCNWQFFERWVQYGVALVHEIINNDMPENHPLRKMWEAVIAKSNKTVVRNLTSYINGGFAGISKKYIAFAQTWLDILHTGYSYFGLTPDQFTDKDFDRTYEFYTQDQDALNMAAMCCDVPLSEYGPEAMDFIQGGKVMSHAVGLAKPWKKNFLLKAFAAVPPSMADKEYWKYANGIIQPYSTAKVRYKRLTIKMASFIGRFYRKH